MLITGKLPRRGLGFSMVELFIVLAIIAIVIMMALPAFRTWLQNTQIRTAAEAVQNGLQVARNEAVRRNAHVEFILTNPDVTGGTGWCVRLVSTDEDVQCKPGGEGSQNVVLKPTPGGATTITFNGLGRVPTTPPNNRDGSAFLSQVDMDITDVTYNDKREMRILITPGGQIKMCDPNVTDTSDPRHC